VRLAPANPRVQPTGVALLLMALFFAYQKWRYDSTTAHMQEQDRPSGGHGPTA
jgi:hypothetical protein